MQQTRKKIISDFNKLRVEIMQRQQSHATQQMTCDGNSKNKLRRSPKDSKHANVIFISQLIENSVHFGKKITGRCVVKPLLMTAIHTVIEDDFDTVVCLSIYGYRNPNKYSIGKKICIHEPYYKLAADGTYRIRIDDTSKIEMLSEKIPIGFQEKSIYDWKELANQCFADKNFKYSNQCYSRGIQFYNDMKNDNVLCALLNNRALCYIKLKKYKTAYVNIIASKYINSNIFKTWHRQIICLKELKYHYQAYVVWSSAIKFFVKEKKELMQLQKKFKISNSFKSKQKKNIIDSEWDILGIIVNELNESMKNEQSKKFEKQRKKNKSKSGTYLKEIGNKEFRQSNYQQAINYYTEGISIHYHIVSILLSNRSAALIHLKEYKKAFKDATISVILNSNNIKGWYRRTMTAFLLNLDEIGNAISQHFEGKNETFTKMICKFRSDQKEYKYDNKLEIESKPNAKAFMSTDQMAMMNNLMSSMPYGSKHCYSLVKMPEFHISFSKKRKYPTGSDAKQCYERLHTAYEVARGIRMHEFNILRKDYVMSSSDIVTRLGNVTEKRIKWWYHAKRGDIDMNYFEDQDKMGYNIANQWKTTFHSFSNAPDCDIIIFSGQTHIAVGFCDLGLLTKCKIRKSEKNGPVKFVGVDLSAYSIAKPYVIHGMLKDKQISIESILEVWYSATWSKLTKSDFYQILDKILKTHKIDDAVWNFIQHWQHCKGISIPRARKEWHQSLTDKFSLIGCFNNLDDMYDYAEYVLSGDILRENVNSFCGNITMFHNPKGAEKHKNENVFQIMEMNKLFVETWEQCKSLKNTVKLILLQNIKKLKNRILNKEVVVQFIHDTLTPNNKPLINKLKHMKPYSVSWSNCIDYIHPTKLHKMAKQIGDKDCVHFAYSMNWAYSIQGAHILDCNTVDGKRQMIEISKTAIKMVWTDLGIDKIFKFPPIDNVLNFGSAAHIMYFQREWIKWFLSAEIANSNIKYCEDSIIALYYSPLHRANTVMNFCWSYDEEIYFRSE